MLPCHTGIYSSNFGQYNICTITNTCTLSLFSFLFTLGINVYFYYSTIWYLDKCTYILFISTLRTHFRFIILNSELYSQLYWLRTNIDHNKINVISDNVIQVSNCLCNNYQIVSREDNGEIFRYNYYIGINTEP